MEKIIEIAKKLKALAERGERGEKINAENKLKALLKKYNISPEELESEIKNNEIIKYKAAYKQILVQCIVLILGKNAEIFVIKGRRNCFVINCSKAEFIQIQAAYDFFSKHYQKELNIFTQAFIHKNHILPPDAGTINKDNLTTKEKERINRVYNMMDSIEKNTLKKQLNS